MNLNASPQAYWVCKIHALDKRFQYSKILFKLYFRSPHEKFKKISLNNSTIAIKKIMMEKLNSGSEMSTLINTFYEINSLHTKKVFIKKYLKSVLTNKN